MGKQVLGLPDEAQLTRELLLDRIDHIVVTIDFHLVYYLNDGQTKIADWSDDFGWSEERRKIASERMKAIWTNAFINELYTPERRKEHGKKTHRKGAV